MKVSNKYRVCICMCIYQERWVCLESRRGDMAWMWTVLWASSVWIRSRSSQIGNPVLPAVNFHVSWAIWRRVDWWPCERHSNFTTISYLALFSNQHEAALGNPIYTTPFIFQSHFSHFPNNMCPNKQNFLMGSWDNSDYPTWLRVAPE